MGLTCSLLGHAYGEPVTERDRERRGNEEVVTVKKLRTCNRCGAETVLSENTEVRHLGSGRDERDQRPPAEVDERGPVESPGTEPGTEGAADGAPGSVEPETGETTEAAAGKMEPDSEDGAEADVSEIIETAEESETPGSGSRSTDPTQGEAVSASESPADATEPDAGTSEVDATGAEQEDPGTGSAETESDATPGTAESDDGIIIDDGAEAAGERGEESTDEPATHPEDSPGADEDSLTGRDSIDDIEETAAEGATETASERSASRAPDEPRDATESTAEPESMFGTTAEKTAEGTRKSVESEPAEQRDAWKERPPSEAGDTEQADNRAGQTAEGSADPAFQFESPAGTEDGDAGSSAARRGPSGIASEGPLEVDEETETPYESLVCPECGFSESAVSSLRAGDICPECHRGYLAGRR